jgi:hypothetical protein
VPPLRRRERLRPKPSKTARILEANHFACCRLSRSPPLHPQHVLPRRSPFRAPLHRPARRSRARSRRPHLPHLPPSSLRPRRAHHPGSPPSAYAHPVQSINPRILVQGPGGKAGEVPTDYEQATGLERFELLMKLKGEEAFSLEPLEVVKMGTLADPVEVFSLVNHFSLLSFSSWRAANGTDGIGRKGLRGRAQEIKELT